MAKRRHKSSTLNLSLPLQISPGCWPNCPDKKRPKKCTLNSSSLALSSSFLLFIDFHFQRVLGCVIQEYRRFIFEFM